MKEIEIEK